MTQVATKNGRVATEGAESAPAQGGLYEKLAAIAKAAREGDLLKATGKLEHGDRKVYSIGDVEAAIGPLCAEHGIVTRWSAVSLDSYEQPTKNGSMRMWISHLRVKVTDAESGESFEDDGIDIGTNPMAAASFVRKGYYKALFHLAEESDEAKDDAPAEGGGTQATAATRPQQRTDGERVPCQECAALGLKNKKGYAPVFWPGNTTCDGQTAGGKYINHKLPVPDPLPQLTGVGAAVSAAADASPDENGRMPWE